MFMTSFEKKGFVSTFSNSLVSPTDSAAAASALATGQKFDNKEVSRHNGIDVETISEIAKKQELGLELSQPTVWTGQLLLAFRRTQTGEEIATKLLKGKSQAKSTFSLAQAKTPMITIKEKLKAKDLHIQVI